MIRFLQVLVIIVMVIYIVGSVANDAAELMAEPVTNYLKISEVAWAGTRASPNDEWFELYNVSGSALVINNWYVELTMQGDVTRTISIPNMTVDINQSALLERTDDNTVANKHADGIFNGSLPNSGVIAMRLYSWDDVLQDEILMPDGVWPAGNANYYASMSLDYLSNTWYTSGPGFGQDALGYTILGSPGMTNEPAGEPDCSTFAWYSYNYQMFTRYYEDDSVSFNVDIWMALGDGSQVVGELWWSTGLAAPRGWNQRPIDWPTGITDGCIDAFEYVMDGSMNILNRQPSGYMPFYLPDKMVRFLNEVQQFQASHPFEAALPVVIGD